MPRKHDPHIQTIKRDRNKFIVKTKRCVGCPFSKNQTTVSPERIEDIKRHLEKTNRPFVCHEAEWLVCRGFYDTVPNLVVHLARMLGITEFEDVESTSFWDRSTDHA